MLSNNVLFTKTVVGSGLPTPDQDNVEKKEKVAGFKLQGIKTKLHYRDSLVMTQNRLMK